MSMKVLKNGLRDLPEPCAFDLVVVGAGLSLIHI